MVSIINKFNTVLQKKRGNPMQIIIFTVLIIIAAIIIFFNIPYSKTKSEFNSVISNIIENTQKREDVFTTEDIKDLPSPLQKYFEYCGYLGTPKMSCMKATFKNVDFKMSPDKTIKIDYTQYNFVNKPERFAFIDSSLYGVPFEGFDSYRDGIGSMKGSLAKVITLFDQRGAAMDKACLVTILAESPVIPNVALQDYIRWEAVDSTHARASITYNGISAGGIFTFDDRGLILSFNTKDRVSTSMDGSTREAEWSAIFSDYRLVNGLRQPGVLQSIWHYPEGDFLYFNQNRASVKFEFI